MSGSIVCQPLSSLEDVEILFTAADAQGHAIPGVAQLPPQVAAAVALGGREAFQGGTCVSPVRRFDDAGAVFMAQQMLVRSVPRRRATGHLIGAERARDRQLH